VIQTGPPRPEISQTAELDSSTYTSLGIAEEFLTVVQFRSRGGAEDDLRSDATGQQSATTLYQELLRESGAKAQGIQY
jgi:hypothetical protein